MTDSTRAPTDWNGFPLFVRDEGAGEVVLFLHSSGMSGDQWRRSAEPIARGGLRTVVPDLIGSGRSAPWTEARPFDFLEDVEVVLRLVRHLGQPVHLVGHSYGGLVALHVARRAIGGPMRVLSLALYDPVAFGVLVPEREAEAMRDLARVSLDFGASPAEHEAWLRGFVEYWGGAGAWSGLREAARAEFVRVGRVVFEGVCSLSADATRAEAYRPLEIPTLLMSGEHTPVAAGRVVSILGETLPAARVERIAGAGHMGPLTHVQAVNALLAAHLRLPATTPATKPVEG